MTSALPGPNRTPVHQELVVKIAPLSELKESPGVTVRLDESYTSDVLNPFSTDIIEGTAGAPSKWNQLNDAYKAQITNRKTKFERQNKALKALSDPLNATAAAAASIPEVEENAQDAERHTKSTNLAEPKPTTTARPNTKGPLAAALGAVTTYPEGPQTVGFISNLAHKDTTQIQSELQVAADFLKQAPKDSLAADEVPISSGDFYSAVGTAAAVIPLSGIAVYQSIREAHNARKQVKAFKQEAKMLKRRIDNSGELLTRLYAREHTYTGNVKEQNRRSLANSINEDESRLLAIKDGLKMARLDTATGVASATTASALLVKGLSTIGFKLSLGIKGVVGSKGFFSFGEVAQQSAGVGVAALGVGIASSLVLGPIAAVGSFAVGALMTVKAGIRKEKLKENLKHALVDLREYDDILFADSGLEKVAEAYTQFILKEGQERTRLFRSVSRLSKAFWVGSGLFAASTTTKVVVTGLALAGVAAVASNPITLGVVIGVTSLAGLIMGGSAIALWIKNSKNRQANKNAALDHPKVDRHFLAGLDTVTFTNPDSSDAHQAKIAGHTARVKCFNWISQRQSASNKLLADAGTMNEHIAPANLEKRTIWNKVRGKWLNNKDVSTLLDNSGDPLKGFLTNDLKARIDYLQEKVKLRLKLMAADGIKLPDNINFEGKADKHYKHYIEHLKNYDTQLDNDQAELEKCIGLLAQVSAIANPNADDSKAVLVTLASDYLNVEQRSKDSAKRRDTLAKALLHNLGADTANAQRVLFESQLQGSKYKNLIK